jgi:hypothetical protein
VRKSYTVSVIVEGNKMPDAGADFECEDGVMLQALANFLNHVGTKEEIRETEERMYRDDPTLRRDIARAQLYGQFGRVGEPDRPEPATRGDDADDAALYRDPDSNRTDVPE